MGSEGKLKRKRRKTSPRPSRYRGRLKKPGVSENNRKHWADPVWRAMMMEKRRLAGLRKLGNTDRYGIPDGMRKAEADALNQAAKESAEQTMSDLKKTGVLDGVDPRSEEALETSIGIMRKPGDKKVQLAAARLVLEYTKSKPASKVEATVNAAEAWLAAITSKDDNDKGETSQDA
jgi:hypothetical protein